MSITAEAKSEVAQLLRQGHKNAAIKYLCDTFGILPDESTILVEALENEIGLHARSAIDKPDRTTLQGPLRAEVIALLQIGKKIEAVNRVKTSIDISLKEALILVEQLDQETNPDYKAYQLKTGCAATAFKIVSYMCWAILVIALACTGIVYYYIVDQLNKSDRLSGRVIELKYEEGMGTA